MFYHRIETRSHAPLDAAAVIEHCEKTIAHISRERERLDCEYVEDFRRRKSWLRRLFRMPELTTEEAKRRIEDEKSNAMSIVHSDYPSTFAWGSLDVARKLLALAKHAANGVVFVTSEDWDFIK